MDTTETLFGVLIISFIILFILALIAGAIIFVFWAAGTGLKLAGFALLSGVIV